MSDDKKTKQRGPMYVAAKLVTELTTASGKVNKAKAKLKEADAELEGLVKGLASQPAEVQEAVSRMRQPAAAQPTAK